MPYRLDSVQETFNSIAGSYFYFDCKNCMASAYDCKPLLRPDGMYCPGTNEVARFDKIKRFVDSNPALHNFCYTEEKEPEPKPVHPVIAKAIAEASEAS